MKFIDIQNTTTIARSFGTKVSVISWIEVSACTNPIDTPVTKAAVSTGMEIRTAIQSPCLRVSKKTISLAISDGHPQDFLIGLNDLVADRYGGLYGKFCLSQSLNKRVWVRVSDHRLLGQ